MEIYARSDVMGVSIPAESGGCGQTHSRPVTDGAPAKKFALDCPSCSVVLKDDPLWSKHADDLPLTPDEQAKQEAEAKLGMIASKENLVTGIAQGISEGLSNLTSCRSCGKMNPSAMRFCGECGHKLGAPDPEPAKPVEAVKKEEKVDDTDLRKFTVPKLRALAEERGLDTSGSKTELLVRLQQSDA